MKTFAFASLLVLSCSSCAVVSVSGTVLSTGFSVAGSAVQAGVSVTGSAVRGVAGALSAAVEKN